MHGLTKSVVIQKRHREFQLSDHQLTHCLRLPSSTFTRTAITFSFTRSRMGHFQSAHRSSIKFSPSASHQYMQSIWRKIQSLGLEDVYRSNDPTLKPFVQEMAVIAFCPSSFVCPAWLGVQQEAPQIPPVDSLVEYFDSARIIGQFQLELFRFGWPTRQQPC